MTGNQTMDYYVRPRHLYSHSRTCTRSGLCRRPSRWVASLICYLLDRASVHEISALVTCSSICQTFPATMEILIYCISSALWRSWSFVYLHHGDSDLCILYVAMTTYVLSCIMPIHGHCTLMYPGLLDVFADYMQSCIMVLCWLGGWSSIWVPSSLPSWDGLIMYFGHRITPLISYIRGHLL